jgi:hypothetical protein
MDRFKLLHKEGKNVQFSKNVDHINDTVKIVKNIQKVFTTLFQTNERTKLEIMEFLTGIDINLTPDCLSAVLRIYSLIKKIRLTGD